MGQAREFLKEQRSGWRVATTELPFEDSGSDVVWSQHVVMNIADRAGLYRELRPSPENGWDIRVLRSVRARQW
jgi:Methyltransferase domain